MRAGLWVRAGLCVCSGLCVLDCVCVSLYVCVCRSVPSFVFFFVYLSVCVPIRAYLTTQKIAIALFSPRAMVKLTVVTSPKQREGSLFNLASCSSRKFKNEFRMRRNFSVEKSANTAKRQASCLFQ